MKEYAQVSAPIPTISETQAVTAADIPTLQDMYVTELKYSPRVDQGEKEIKRTDCHGDCHRAF